MPSLQKHKLKIKSGIIPTSLKSKIKNSSSRNMSNQSNILYNNYINSTISPAPNSQILGLTPHLKSSKMNATQKRASRLANMSSDEKHKSKTNKSALSSSFLPPIRNNSRL